MATRKSPPAPCPPPSRPFRVPAVVDRALVPELQEHSAAGLVDAGHAHPPRLARAGRDPCKRGVLRRARRSEAHTSELQSRFDLVCRLLLEKKTSGLVRST